MDVDAQNNPLHTVLHDGVGHHPLGAASYYFRHDIVDWISARAKSDQMSISIGAQPNSSPHLGNLVVIAVAFALAQRLSKKKQGVRVVLDFVDTAPAPGSDIEIQGVTYQKSLRWSYESTKHLKDFEEVLQVLSQASNVPYITRSQTKILRNPVAATTIRHLLQRHDELGRLFSPRTGCIGLRAACPVKDCGLADKAGINNRYEENQISFQCPHHGTHALNLHDPDDICRLELNTPLRNLLRSLIFQADDETDWIRLTGSDYAGFYQEQFLWRPLMDMNGAATSDRRPLILYSPQILDWSGAKLSKSLYVRSDAYEYLRGSALEYVLSYTLYKASGKSLEDLFRVCEGWIDRPAELFRAYTIYHMDTLLTKARCDRVQSDTNRRC